MSCDLVSFVFFQLLVNLFCKSRLIHIQPQFHQPKKNQEWRVALVHSTQLLLARLNSQEVVHSLKSSKFSLSLGKEFPSLLEPTVIFCSESMWKKPVLAPLSNMNFRVRESSRGRWPTIITIFFACFSSRYVEGVVFFVEADKLFYFSGDQYVLK